MSKLAQTLMVQGTASTVGKSTLVTGLCRLFAREGWRVAPFKAQNMALNSWVTRDGKEMGRAQVVQAEAAGIEPTVEMNPILLKPESDSRSQVIVMGRPLASLEAQAYYRNRSTMLSVIEQSLATLRQQYDLVIIEGAGSPVELNLRPYDMVNMRVAHLADAPVLLVGDIDRGGIFASLLGTLMLLEPEKRARVKGLIVNKFRGDMALWRPGEQLLAEHAGIPVLGTVPFFKDIRIAEEDVVALDEGTAAILQGQPETGGEQLDVVVIRFPYLSNYDEFDALAADPRVRLRFVSSPEEFLEPPDLIILPGTKNTLHDLAWLRARGLATHIRQFAEQEVAVLGICGGYQMLGARVIDELGSEGEPEKEERGLQLIDVETFFAPMQEKTTLRCQATVLKGAKGILAGLDSQPFNAYQIHLGRTVPLNGISHSHKDNKAQFRVEQTGYDGWCSSSGWTAGCYLHGLFENDIFRNSVIATLAARRSLALPDSGPVSFSRHAEYDKLADVLQKHLDIAQLKRLCDLRE